MGPAYHKLVDEAKYAMEDPLAVPLEGYTQWASDAASLVFKNKDTCSMTQIYDDYRQWCIEDEMRCFFGKGIEDRIINNAVGLISTAIEFGKLMFVNDWCYSDAEIAGEVSTMMEDFGKMQAYTTGFNHQWGALGAAEHMTPDEFEAAAHDFLATNWMTPHAMLEMNWPQTLELFNTAKGDVTAFSDAFVRPVYTVVNNFMWYVELWTEVILWIVGWETYDLTTTAWGFMTSGLAELFNCDESEIWDQTLDWAFLSSGLFFIFMAY